MSVDQLPPGKARSASREPQLVRYGEYVDQQIESTRKLVKFVDAMTVLLTITIGTILFLLTAAVVEHWLVPNGYNFTVRLLLFLALIGSVGYYAVRRLWPLCVSAINPAYAAQAIEHDNPALKNSLLNLLLFRQNREQVTDAVYETLEEQAAKRLTRVPVESAVDRTQLLRLAYVLMVIVAIAAIYKIFSPKDPFVTAERVLLPWANVVPASRVSIENVEPGHVTLARGELLTVSADVRGIGDDDPVIVKFTTADGQAVDRPAAMTPSATGLRFTGQIPPANDAAHTGLAQNLRYRIEAGDARSLEYSVTVIAAPTITIDRIEYDYPDYTGLADRSVERQGDIHAIEGTRVTIFARANQPIEEASLDFEADGRRDATLQIDGTIARTGFELALRDDRQTPKFTSYVLRFTDVEGRSNRNPVKYPIEVEVDVSPEVTVLAPKEKTREVRLDETVTIEVDAIDSDFGLAEVCVHGEAAGRTVIDEKLLNKPHTGHYTGRVRFMPIDHSLQPGDVVRYWVTARDERPNETASDSQTLRITSPDPNHPRPDRLAQREEPKPQNENSQQDSDQQGEAGESGESGGAGASDSSQGKEGEQPGESASAGGQNGQPSEQNQNNQPGEQQSEQQSDQPGEQGNGQSAEGQAGSNESDSNQSGEQEGTAGQSGGNQSGSSEQQGEQSGDAQQQPGNSSGNTSGDSGSSNNSEQPSSGKPSGNESGQSEANNNPQQRPNPSGQSSGDQQNNGEQQPGESDAPVSSEGDNDGEAFERIQKFLQRDGKLPEQNDSNEKSTESSQQNQEGESASADGQSGAKSEEESDSASDGNAAKGNDPAEGPGAETHSGDNPEQTKEPAEGKQPEDSQSPGGQQTSSKGESGAGDESKQNQGSPDSQPTTKPTDKESTKWDQKPSGDKQGEQEPSSGGRGKQESDSQGNEGGDHTGGGEEGGGQKANRDGTGSSGQNQSADEGAGESSEQGAGNTSSNSGDDAQSKSPTGESSENQSGAGSSQRDGTGNQQGGESPDENKSVPGEPASAGGQEGANNQPPQNQQTGEPPENQQSKQNTDQSNSQDQTDDRQPNDQQGAGDQPGAPRGGEDAPDRSENSQSAQNSGSDAMSGAGRPPQGVIPPSKTDGTAPAADDANLDYARKRTDLVLETLAEQMKRRQVDKRLLDELGWTEADMKRFLDRWQQLKAAAQDNNTSANDAQRELDDALRSLGLRRGVLQQSKVSDDTDRDLRQGFRGPVPQEYQDRLKAYNQGVSRARQQDE